jgi:universal stress protein A
MQTYRNILAVVDLGEHSERVARRAADIAACTPGAQLTLLHVVEFVPVEPLGDSLLPTLQIESELLERGRQRLAELALTLASPPRREVVSGNVKTEITRLARELACDLIVIGGRERHGLSILVNLTEDTVLHAAPCDVLAVRLPALKPAT